MSSEVNPSNLFPFLIANITRMYSVEMDRRLREAGLTLSHSQWRVIAYLYYEDGQFQSQLAELMMMEKAPLGTLIDKLEASGYISRRPDPNDRRLKRVFITAQGRELFPLLERESRELQSIGMNNWDDDKKELLLALLSDIRTNVSEYRENKDKNKDSATAA
jgi:MarR family transcriptional regulator, transcriptional regulator for hemolysin